ncbi:MAG: radical SAM protein [Proteiniphilum sp.]|jgi:radical SAM protein with 4Fe4S-binding SPASM domain|nr:radical SAM protein [Proteiniphilum sp.]
MKNRSTRRFYFALTERCNLHCSHCFNQSGEREDTDDLTTDQALNVIDAACREGYECMQLTGGEALLRRDIFDIIRHIHARGMLVSIQTNGVIGKKVMAALMLLDAGRTEFIVSLDGIRTHSAFRGREAMLQTMASIRQLSPLFPLRINSLLSAHISRQEVGAVIDLAYSVNASVAFNPVCLSGRGKAADVMGCADYFARMIELQRQGGVRIRKGFDYADGSFRETEDCPVRKGTAIFVSHNGDCYPCGFLEVHKELCMGNLVALRYDLKQVFRNYPVTCRKVTDACLSCAYYLSRHCFAGCPARIFAANNTFDAREIYCMKAYYLLNEHKKNGESTLPGSTGMERS